MKDLIIDTIFLVVYLVVGAFDIWMAIDNFIERKYFNFGVWTMCAITNVLFLANIIL